MDGKVGDIRTGRIVGKTADIEAEFLKAVQAEKDPCYVIVGTGASERFLAGLAAIGVPVVHDEAVGDGALILSGSPEGEEA